MTTVQDTVHSQGRATYDVYIEIDCDCQELLDAIGLDYIQCEDDDTQNEVVLSLDKDEYKDSLQYLCFDDMDEQTISTILLNPELGEYTTKVTIYKPNGDKVTFE